MMDILFIFGMIIAVVAVLAALWLKVDNLREIKKRKRNEST